MEISENAKSEEASSSTNERTIAKPNIAEVIKDENGPSLFKAVVSQKASEDGHTAPTSDSLLGVVSHPTNVPKNARPRAGGWTVEIPRDSPPGGCGAILEGTSDPSASSYYKPNSLTNDELINTEPPITNLTINSVIIEEPLLIDESSVHTVSSSSSSNQLFSVPESTLNNDTTNERVVQCTAYENICRICHETDQVEALISPCLCRGSLSLVHRTCLQHWLAESDSSTCELCRFKYLTKRVPKYSLVGSFLIWIKLNKRQRRAMLLDTLGLIVIVPFATILTCIATSLADSLEYEESPSLRDVTARFAIVSLISMMTTIDVAFATWGLLRIQHHFTTWYSWYRRNSEVTLIPQFSLDTLD